jgi:ABC-2 type transport system permease protein
LPILLPAVPALVVFVYVLQKGAVDVPGTVSPVTWTTVEGILSFWASFVLPLLVAIVCSFLASIEHTNNGWKHLLALPVPRSAAFASKLTMASALVALAHAALAVYTVTAVWALTKLGETTASAGALELTKTTLLVLLVGLGGTFLVAVHAVVALRWPGFALNIGSALAGLLLGVTLVESTLQNVFPWSLPAAVKNLASPLVYGLPGRGGPEHVAVLVATSTIACLLVMALGTWWLCRRDVA